MMIKIISDNIHSLEDYVNNKATAEGEVQIVWIGQAGFILKFKKKLLIIDPYLSNYLSKKYEGKLFPHIRLMDVPILLDKLTNIDFILSTHAHSDHMDPETLTILSNNNPDCKIIVPAAEIEESLNRGAKSNQILPCNDGKLIDLYPTMTILGIGASHEILKINEQGEYHFLGYIFHLGDIRIYHSGDCIPYEGLINKLKGLNIDLALLPINGRDEYRKKNGIAGNFKIPEVLELCREAGINNLIVHHFGMFAYNTVAEEELEELRNKSTSDLQIIIPEINQVYKLKKK